MKALIMSIFSVRWPPAPCSVVLILEPCKAKIESLLGFVFLSFFCFPPAKWPSTLAPRLLQSEEWLVFKTVCLHHLWFSPHLPSRFFNIRQILGKIQKRSKQIGCRSLRQAILFFLLFLVSVKRNGDSGLQYLGLSNYTFRAY